MGTIFYGGSASPIVIDDRALAHLKVVIATKLRRGESFTVSWKHPDNRPGGRTTLWLHPSIPLRFSFDEEEPFELDRDWLEELAGSAHSSSGIVLVADHFDTGPIDLASHAGGRHDDTATDDGSDGGASDEPHRLGSR